MPTITGKSIRSSADRIEWTSEPEEASATELARIADRAEAVLKSLVGLSERLHETATRALGPIPTGATETSAAKPQPSGMVGQIDGLLDNVDYFLGRCFDAAERLDRLA